MISSDTRLLVRTIKADKRYKRLYTAFTENQIFNLPVQKLLEEISALQQARPVRRLNLERGNFVDSAVRASVSDQASRSRLASILFDCNLAIHTLNRALTDLEDHICVVYASDLRKYRTKEDRQRVIRLAFKQFRDYIGNVTALRDNCLLFVEDIDKAGYALKMQVTALTAPNAREIRI